MKTLFYLNCEDDDACALFDENGELLYIYDTYHGYHINKKVLEILGFTVVTIDIFDVIDESEYECADLTNEIPSEKLVLSRIKKVIQNLLKERKT